MRLLPSTLAGRTSLLLLVGFAVAAAVTFLASGWGDTSRALLRIGAALTALNRLPAEDRVRVAAALSTGGIRYEWQRDRPPPGTAERDTTTRHLERDLRVALADERLDRIEAAYAADLVDTANGTAAFGPRPIEAWFGLRDNSWVRATIDGPVIGALFTPRIIATGVALVVLLVGLGTWSAWRVTAPLRRFADAAQRLGADLGAAPLDASGPLEIRAAAAAFNQMQRRIRALVDERTLMLAAISHDLRTSLTRLRLRLETIADASQRERALRDLDDMGALLATTLAYARGDAAAEPVTLVDIAVLLQSLCDEAKDAGESATFDGPGRLAIRGQPVGLRRAFDNLIGNAIKYGSEATVEIDPRGDEIEVRVGDRGPGIAPDLRERVFEPFFRVEPSRSRSTGGTGLGLAVARQVIAQHGGTILLADRPGGGLLVRVRLSTGSRRA